MNKIWNALKSIGIFLLSIAALLLYFLPKKKLPDTSNLDNEIDTVDDAIDSANTERNEIRNDINDIDIDIEEVDSELENVSVDSNDVSSAVDYLKNFISNRKTGQ